MLLARYRHAVDPMVAMDDRDAIVRVPSSKLSDHLVSLTVRGHRTPVEGSILDTFCSRATSPQQAECLCHPTEEGLSRSWRMPSADSPTVVSRRMPWSRFHFWKQNEIPATPSGCVRHRRRSAEFRFAGCSPPLLQARMWSDGASTYPCEDAYGAHRSRPTFTQVPARQGAANLRIRAHAQTKDLDGAHGQGTTPVKARGKRSSEGAKQAGSEAAKQRSSEAGDRERRTPVAR